jgi:hypothetical protein
MSLATKSIAWLKAKHAMMSGWIADKPEETYLAPLRVEAEVAAKQLAEAQAKLDKMQAKLEKARAEVERLTTHTSGISAQLEWVGEISSTISEIGGELSRRAELGANRRNFALLHNVLPYGTPLTLSSRGITWTLRFTERGIEWGDTVFKSPIAVTREHARLIHEGHPVETHPGNGWVWLFVAEGEHKEKSLATVYDAYFGRC